MLTDIKNIIERWTAHFSKLLNRPSGVDEEALKNVRKRPEIIALDEYHTKEETLKTIHLLQIGKAPGHIGTLTEIYKVGGVALVDRFTNLPQVFWDNGELPQKLKDANVIHL